MKTKTEIQKELIKEFGENFNIIDNLIIWLKSHYHPQYFTSIKSLLKTHGLYLWIFIIQKSPYNRAFLFI